MSELAVTLTVEQLRELVQESVRAELAASPAAPLPEILEPLDCAKLLGVTTKTLSKFTASEGLPVHYLSEREPRYRRSEVLAWVSSRGRPHADGAAA